jgi:hypothetical protein
VTDGLDVKSVDDVEKALDQMILLEPVAHGRRKPEDLVRVPGAVRLQ